MWKTILVLEDDLANLEVFAAILWANGFNVIEAKTSREALDAVEREHLPVDLLVSDVSLKGDAPSGTDVAAAISDNRKNLPILFVTGTAVEEWNEHDRQNLRLLPPACVKVLGK